MISVFLPTEGLNLSLFHGALWRHYVREELSGKAEAMIFFVRKKLVRINYICTDMKRIFMIMSGTLGAGGRGGGVLNRCFGREVRPGRSNPDPV